jgi:4'-phosphopantetheinyl transferase
MSVGLMTNPARKCCREALFLGGETKGTNHQTEVLSDFQPEIAKAWQLPAKDVVDVWRVRIDPSESLSASLEGLLSPDELARANRFRFARDRGRFVVARAVLRQVLGAYREVPPAALRFAYGPHGKPRLVDSSPDGRHIAFNLSHSEDLALIAVSEGHEIGIDLEAIRPVKVAFALAGHVFSPEERAALATAPDRDRVFYRFWTTKEACAKAVGIGMALLLDDPYARNFPRGTEGVRRSRHTSIQDWRVIPIEPGKGYVGALAMPVGSRLVPRGWRWRS